MQVAITKMSSKGQIVIPSELRGGMKEGEQFIIIKDNGQFILKKVSDLDDNLKEDIMFAKRTEEAWQRYEKGEFKSDTAKNFLNDLDTW